MVVYLFRTRFIEQVENYVREKIGKLYEVSDLLVTIWREATNRAFAGEKLRSEWLEAVFSSYPKRGKEPVEKSIGVLGLIADKLREESLRVLRLAGIEIPRVEVDIDEYLGNFNRFIRLVEEFLRASSNVTIGYNRTALLIYGLRTTTQKWIKEEPYQFDEDEFKEVSKYLGLYTIYKPLFPQYEEYAIWGYPEFHRQVEHSPRSNMYNWIMFKGEPKTLGGAISILNLLIWGLISSSIRCIEPPLPLKALQKIGLKEYIDPFKRYYELVEKAVRISAPHVIEVENYSLKGVGYDLLYEFELRGFSIQKIKPEKDTPRTLASLLDQIRNPLLYGVFDLIIRADRVYLFVAGFRRLGGDIYYPD